MITPFARPWLDEGRAVCIRSKGRLPSGRSLCYRFGDNVLCGIGGGYCGYGLAARADFRSLAGRLPSWTNATRNWTGSRA